MCPQALGCVPMRWSSERGASSLQRAVLCGDEPKDSSTASSTPLVPVSHPGGRLVLSPLKPVSCAGPARRPEALTVRVGIPSRWRERGAVPLAPRLASWGAVWVSAGTACTPTVPDLQFCRWGRPGRARAGPVNALPGCEVAAERVGSVAVTPSRETAGRVWTRVAGRSRPCSGAAGVSAPRTPHPAAGDSADAVTAQ